MFRSMFTVGSLTLVSRLAGFVRDKLIAVHLGGGAMADVWIAAFQLPNLFRRIFGEGAFNSAFVPMYSGRLEEEGAEVADRFASRTLSVMFGLLLTCAVLCFIFMEPIVRISNIGFVADGRFAPAVQASRITIGYLIFVCLVAALSGVLNSRKVFAPSAWAYVALNIVFIAALVLIVPRTESPLMVLSWSVIVSGVVQLLIVLISCWLYGVRLKPMSFRIDDDIKRLGLLMGPGLVSAGIQQVNLLVGGAVASLAVGGKIGMSLADRINQLPLGLIGMAVGVVLLPEITRNLRGGEEEEAKRSLSKGIELSLFLCLPATAALLAIPREMMYAIFEGGKFDGDVASYAGWILAAFATGTPAYILAKVLQPGYYAREDTKTPMRFTIISSVTNIVLVYPFFLWMGVIGCALATSIAGWVNVALLWFGLRGAGFMERSIGFTGRLLRLVLASALMGIVLWVIAFFGHELLMAPGRFVQRVSLVGAMVCIGLFAYLGAVLVLRIYSLDELKKRFRRSRAR